MERYEENVSDRYWKGKVDAVIVNKVELRVNFLSQKQKK